MSKYTTLPLFRLALLLSVALLSQQLAAQTQKTWTNGAGNGKWSELNNWSPIGAPGPNDDVVFDGTSSANCSVNVNPVIGSLEVKGSYGGAINLGTHTFTVNGAVDISSASQFSSPSGSKVIFAGPGRIQCPSSIYELEINMAQATDDIDLRDPLSVTRLTITQVGLLDGDDLSVSQRIINNDPDLDGDAFLSVVGTCTFSGNGLRYLNVEAGASLELLSDLTLERTFELTGSGSIFGSNSLILGSDGRLDYAGTVSADVEINTLDAADVINLRDFFNVSGELLITQVGELSGFDDIRSSGNIIVNDDNIGSRAGIIAIGTGTLSGTGALSQFTVEAGASRQLTSDFKLNNSFELAGGGEITGNFNLILAASGRLNFTGTVSNMEINDVSGGRGIRMQSIFNLTGNLTITQVAGLSGEDFRVGGNITITDNAVGGSALLVLVGSGNTIFQGAGNGDYLDMAIEKDNSTDKVQLNSSDTFREITIRNGILDINGQSPTVDLVIEGGGTLAGSGTVNGFVDGLAGSTISPGNSAGTLTIDGDVTIPGTLIMEIFGNGENNGGTAGTDFDQLVVTGQADIGTLSVLFMGTVGPSFPTSGDSYTLLDSPSVLVGGISISPSYINVSYSAGVIFILSPALPIELLYFNASAKGQAVLLQWATATEHNNDYMAVERSADGVRFTEIGRVLGAGTTQEPREYHFTDDSPLPGLNYYRLRQVDFDGRAEYHKVISILFEGKGANLGLQAFPNPAHSNLQARWSPNSTLGTTLSLMDLNGHLLAEYRIPAGTGSHELQLGHLPSGTYFLRATQKDHTEVLRVVKR